MKKLIKKIKKRNQKKKGLPEQKPLLPQSFTREQSKVLQFDPV